MSYILSIAATFVLFSGFLVFAGIEQRHGARLLGRTRTKLDRQVSRLSFVVTHIDWGGFFAHVGKAAFDRVAHDVIHFTLLLVRATERTLTRIIRTLRERLAKRTGTLPDEGTPLLSTLIRFRKQAQHETVEAPPKEDSEVE